MWCSNAIKEDGAGNGYTQGKLILDLRCGKTRCALLQEEAAHLAIPFAPSPDDKKVPSMQVEGLKYNHCQEYLRYRCVRNPRLAAIQNEATVDFFCGSLHPGGVRTVIRFSKSETADNFTLRCFYVK